MIYLLPTAANKPPTGSPKRGSSSHGLGVKPMMAMRNAMYMPINIFINKPHALNSADVLAHLIQEEMSLGDMMTLFKIRRGHYSVVEEKVPPGAKAIGVALKDLALAEHCVIAAIIRDGVMTLPRGDSALQENDEIIAVASPEGAQKLAEILAHPVYPVRNGNKKE